MRKIFICCLLFVVSGVLIAQHNREEKLQQLKKRPDIEVTEIEKDILKIEYPHGKVTYENIGEYISDTERRINYSPTFDSTIIDLTTFDTTLYYQKYSFWQAVKVGSYQTAPPLVGDLNNNNLPEIYGIIKDYTTDYSNNTVMEKNDQAIFDSVYSYDSTSVARKIYDVNKDGRDELLLHRFPPDTNYPGHSWLFFSKPSDTSLATDLSFIFYPFPENNQLNKNTFGDWDGDKFTDQIFGRDCCPNSIFIYEYNPSANNFDSVYYYDPSQYSLFWSGFAIGDFDQDGYTEFFAGSVNGKVVGIENCGDNCYRPSWNGMVETSAAYLYAATDDLDENGKPELWIGGYHSLDNTGITRLTIFEANGNDNYEAVGKVDLIGAIGWYAKNMQVLDIDQDGKDEIMVCIDQHIVILKFNGSENHHTYEVFYIKRNDLAFSGRNSVFYGAAMYDVTNDGKEDIVIHMDEIIENVGMRLFTFIYKADFSVDVNEGDSVPEEFHLYPNYPNPFNPSTNIRFEIPERSNVSIKVFNVLGKEIITLLEKQLSPGSYTIDWEARDSNGKLLPSGVYLVRFNAANAKNNYANTIKAVLIK